MKILPLLLLALVIHTGCASRPDVGRVRIEVFDNLRQFKLVNETGKDLHNVKVGAWIYSGGELIPAPNHKVGDWPNGEALEGRYKFTYGLQKIELDGSCTEGKFKALWIEGIEQVDPSPLDASLVTQQKFDDSTLDEKPDPNREDLKVPAIFEHWKK